jgi:eukaryotic-like serine/threonine-protein kinase
MELKPDTLLHNRYQILKTLGKGGMGAVYLAYDSSLEIQVAVKSNLNAGQESTSQFLREAYLLASLRHPNLPRVIDYFVIEGNQYLVMDFVPGEDLGFLLERDGAKPLEKVLQWADELGSALTYMHSQNPPVFHRDIKPTNIKLTPNGQVILVDFGIAKAAESTQATETGAAGYTPGFAPPEQYGGGRTGPFSDQYGLAATLYMLLTSQRPVDSVQRAMGQAVLPSVNLFNTTIPTNVCRAIEKAMSSRSEDRFASIDDFVQAMHNPNFNAAAMPTVQAGKASSNLPPTDIPKKIPEAREKLPSWAWAAIGLVVLGGLALVAGVIILSLRSGFIRPADLSTTQPAAILATQTILNPSTTQTPLPLAVMLPTATHTIQPTAEPSITNSPTPLPKLIGDGKVIVFVSDQGDGKTLQLWTMKVVLDNAGKLQAVDQRQITTSQGDKEHPSWSPDGTRLLFSAPTADGDIDIWLLDLTQPNEPAVDISNIKGEDSYPSWSPDGRIIAFTNKSRFTDYLQLYFVNPDGSNRRRVSLDFEEYAAIWAPSNEWLLYIIHAQDHRYFFMRNKTAGYATPQPFDPTSFFGRLGEVADPSWSPDGSRIAFTRVDGKKQQIYSLEFKSRGGNATLLTANSTNSSQPTWSPDMQWIAYTDIKGGDSNIYVMTSAGLLPSMLTNHPGRDFQPAWQP